MNAFLVCVTRWMLTSFWVFGALQHSESAIVCQDKPEDPKIVVLGVNSSVVSLNWEKCAPNAGETIISFSFRRQRPSSLQVDQIASRGPTEGGFTMIAPFQNKNKYDARALQELRILNVQKNEEYVYTLAIHYKTIRGAFLEQPFRVTVDVKEPPEITEFREREDELNLDSVKNHTLKCNASGDPHPNITWRKAGVPASQFNASGYLLHLVNVQREDAGSYICTASNGYGEDATAIGIVNIRCPDCKTETVGITIDLTFKDPLKIKESKEFRELESPLLSAISSAYADNPGRRPYKMDVKEFRKGSVFAIVELAFGSSVSDPLKPLRDEMNDRKLGSFTVDRQLVENPTDPPTTESTESTTVDKREPPTGGARTSSLTEGELWGIIGGCIGFVVVVAVIILVCCICRKKSKNSGTSKGGKSYSEADGYRMNRQPPPSGLGTASPAYVEARQYAPVTAARRQDDQSKPPLNYADLSLNNSSGPGRKPPPYSGTEYSEMSPEKRPPPAGGQQGEGGGFELWC